MYIILNQDVHMMVEHSNIFTKCRFNICFSKKSISKLHCKTRPPKADVIRGDQYSKFAARISKNMADLDNLEYYIKFPNPNFNYNQNNGDNDFVFVVNEDKIPVILLFGWAGCQDKYLSKYSQMYEEKG